MYRDWVGPFYPSTLRIRERFAFYASQFDTVELDTTFYRLPTPSTVEAWAAAAPPGFTYALKLGAFGSHRMKLRDAASWLGNHVDRVLRLGPTLGPNVVQLPPRWRRDVARLDEFLAAAGGHGIRWAVELREASWIHDDVFTVLDRHGAALVLHDLLPGLPWVRTTDWTYLRFHGPDATAAKYLGRNGPQRLAPVAEQLAPWVAEGSDVFAYFNNDWHAHAIHDARTLRSMLAEVTDRPGAAGR